MLTKYSSYTSKCELFNAPNSFGIISSFWTIWLKHSFAPGIDSTCFLNMLSAIGIRPKVIHLKQSFKRDSPWDLNSSNKNIITKDAIAPPLECPKRIKHNHTLLCCRMNLLMTIILKKIIWQTDISNSTVININEPTTWEN